MKLPLLFTLAVAFAASASAKIVLQPVAYEHAGTKLEGWLAYDDKKLSPGEKAPGVLIVPEWWGINDYVKGRAEKVAKLGYVAFVADMYGAGVSTTDPKKAGELAGQFYGKPLMAERAQAGLDQLLKEAHVDTARIAAIGYCFGGSTVQALAYTGAPLAGIVSFHGGLLPVPADAATKTKAKLLFCNGAADPAVKPEAITALESSLEGAGLDYQFINYAHAKHAFTNPDADKLAAAGLSIVAYNEAADRRSWQHMKVFFHEIFAAK